MAMLNSELLVYQMGKPPFSYGFPMVFLWFSYDFYGFPMVLRYTPLPQREFFTAEGKGQGKLRPTATEHAVGIN